MKTRLKPIVTGSLISLLLLASFPIIAVAGKLNADEDDAICCAS